MIGYPFNLYGKEKHEAIPLKELLNLDIPDSLKENSDTVVLLDDVRMELKKDRLYIVSRIVKKVLKAKRHGKIAFSFTENKFSKIFCVALQRCL